MNDMLKFNTMDIPISADVDVLVVGGGTSGVFAGIASAKMGSDTLLIEQFSGAGGSQTQALVMPVMPTGIIGSPLSSGIVKEVNRRMIEMNAAENGGSLFEPLSLKLLYDDMLEESGCNVLYGTRVISAVKINSRISYIVVHNASGISAIKAKQFIDCTGDGELSVVAGANYSSGNQNGVNQAVSLRFHMTGVDIEKFRSYMIEIDKKYKDSVYGKRGASLHAAAVHTMEYKFPLTHDFNKACDDGMLTKQDIRYFQCFSAPGKPYDLYFNCPELGSSDKTTTAEFQTKKHIEGRRAIRRIITFLTERVPGFENAYLCETAQLLGIRESRNIETEYILSYRDVLNYARFDDFIAVSNYGMDVHDAGYESDGSNFRVEMKYKECDNPLERYYQIPFRSLVVKDSDNLFVAGRCMGADFLAQSTVRIQFTCRASGEAAGIGASLAVQNDKKAKDIQGSHVREIMSGWGADFTPADC